MVYWIFYIYMFPVERALGTAEGGEGKRCGRLVPTARRLEPVGAHTVAPPCPALLRRSLCPSMCVYGHDARSPPSLPPSAGACVLSDPQPRRPPALRRCLRTRSRRWPAPRNRDGDGPRDPGAEESGGPAGWGLPPPVSVCIRHALPHPAPSAGVTGTEGVWLEHNCCLSSHACHELVRKLGQPRCLPRYPFLLLSLWQRKENNRQPRFLWGWRRSKDCW